MKNQPTSCRGEAITLRFQKFTGRPGGWDEGQGASDGAWGGGREQGEGSETLASGPELKEVLKNPRRQEERSK